GLYHTFWGTKYNFGTCSTMRGELSGTSPCTKKGSNQSPEYVNGTNASSSGDFIPDTSADPNTWTTSGNYNEICYCVNENSSYSPLANNIMSYNSSSSRTNNPHDMTTNQATSMNLASREDRYLSMTHAVDIIGASSIFNNDIIDYNYSTTMDPNNIYSVTYNMTNNSNAVSINSSTGVVNVMGVTEGIETLTCTVRHKYNAPWNDLI
ncbi:MAG: hypothetical protein L3J54_10310, partial [Draconibacterium sp.]|nr:hypothetical protein [Draconibacterium sp.]